MIIISLSKKTLVCFLVSLAAAAGYGTRKDTLTVSFHTILPSETFGLAVFLTV